MNKIGEILCYLYITLKNGYEKALIKDKKLFNKKTK